MVRPISELVKLYNTAKPTPKGEALDSTAEKIIPIGKQLMSPQKQAGLRDRHVTQLTDAEDLSSKVLSLRNDWDELAPEEIAEKLSELGNRISLLTPEEKADPAIQKTLSVFQKSEFDYVFPLSRDFIPFAENIHEMAHEILKNQTIEPFKELNPTQQWQVMDTARRGA